MGLGSFIGIEWQIIEDPTERALVTKHAIRHALQLGYRHIDLAENYHNLTAIGEALTEAFKPESEGGLGLTRDDVWLTMKANPPLDEAHLMSLLQSMQVDYFDLLLIHHPQSCFESEDVLTQAWEQLVHHHDVGRIHHLGVSNCYQPHLERLLAVCEKNDFLKPSVNQISFNPWEKDFELLNYCVEHAIQIMACSPLAYAYSGWLLANETLVQIASDVSQEKGQVVTPAQLVLAWMMQKNIAVIPKSTQLAHLEENMHAMGVDLDERYVHRMDDIPPLPDLGTETTAKAKTHAGQLDWSVVRLGCSY
jgi:diketogulonate reductase-like aldo/keto reductase